MRRVKKLYRASSFFTSSRRSQEEAALKFPLWVSFRTVCVVLSPAVFRLSYSISQYHFHSQNAQTYSYIVIQQCSRGRKLIIDTSLISELIYLFGFRSCMLSFWFGGHLLFLSINLNKKELQALRS